MTIAPNSQYNSAQGYTKGQQVLVGSVVYQALENVPPATPPTSNLGTYWESVAVPQPPLGVERLYAIPFDHSTGSTALAAGIDIRTLGDYVPQVGDVIDDAWFDVTTAFNGTTPLADFGSFSSAEGLFLELNSAAVDMTAATGAVADNTGIDKIGGARLNKVAGSPLRIVAVSDEPPVIDLVVSETGHKGGTASGATAGAAVLYIKVIPAA